MQKSSEVSIKELRQFGLIMGAFVALFFGLLIPWVWGLAYSVWVWAIAATFISVALALPFLLKPIYTIWMKLAHVLGWINTRLLLGIVFYLIVLPMGLFMRLLGKDPMRRQCDSNAKSYRIKSKQPSTDRLEKPF